MDVLPLGQTVQTSYETVRDGLRPLARAAALWLVLLLLLDAVLRLGRAEPAAPAAEVTGPVPGDMLAFTLETAATLIAVAAIGVVWHRHVLNRDPVGDRTAPLDGPVVRYLGMTVLIALIAGLPIGLFLALLTSLAGGPGQGTQVLAVLMLALGAVVWVRLNLVLPAAAIGDATMTIRRSWERTRGQALKILAGILLTSVPTAIAAAVLAAIAAAIVGDTPILRALPRAIGLAANFLETALVATFLSLAYRRLGGEAARGDG